MLISEALREEWETVMARAKFDKQSPLYVRMRDLRTVIAFTEHVNVVIEIRECRDPKDDHLLALALDGHADVIVTGDQDLLVLNPWRGVRILTPAEFLESDVE